MGAVWSKNKREKKERRMAAVKRANEKYLSDKKRIQITLPPEEAQMIIEAAKMRGLSPTTYVRKVSVEVASRDIKKARG